MGVGSLLEKARVEQGLTIEELAERTKIRPQFLQAIEEEQYHLLPDQAYVRPFIRTYARALGWKTSCRWKWNPGNPPCG